METKFAAIHRKMLMPARQLPITGSAHKAGVVGEAHVAAIIALLDVLAERRRPARRDGADDAPLDAAEVPGTGLPKRFAVAAEDVRHLSRTGAMMPLSRAARPPDEDGQAGLACC